MKITEETLDFPSALKEKILKMINTSRISVEFINGKNIIFDKTNLAITEPNIIIFSNPQNFVKIFNYGENELFSKTSNNSIAFNTLVEIINKSL